MLKVKRTKNYHLIDQILLISFISLICKIIGFVREIVLAKYFGTTKVVDYFLVAESIVPILFGWTAAIGAAFTPVYQETSVIDRDRANNLFVNLLTIIGFISLPIVILGCLFNSQILQIVIRNNIVQKELKAMYLICLFSYLYYSKYHLLTNYLNCNENYFGATWPNLCLSLIQIIFIYFGYLYKTPIFLALGVAMAYLCQYIFLIYQCKIKKEYFKFSHNNYLKIKEVIIISLPLIISILISRINVMIDKMFASSLTEGKISALSYADTLHQSIYTIITMVVLQVFYPKIAKLAAENKKKDIEKNIKQTLETIAIIMLPLIIITCIYAKWIVEIIFQRGSFDAFSTLTTARSFQCYFIGLFAMAIRDVTNEVCKSFKKSDTACFLSAINIGINVILNFILVKKLDYIGLSISTSISAFLIIPLEYVCLNRMVGFKYCSKEIAKYAKITLISIFVGFIGYIIKYYLDVIYINSIFLVKIIMLIICYLITGGVYFLIAKKLSIFSNNYIEFLKGRYFGRAVK